MKSFEESMKKFVDDRTDVVEKLISDNDPKFKEISKKTQALVKEIALELGDKSSLVYCLEEAMTNAAIITDRAIYRQGLRDGIQLVR